MTRPVPPPPGGPSGIDWPFFAIAAPGLEAVLAGELVALGLPAEAVPGGVGFGHDLRALYEANLRCRVASRILVRIASFSATAFYELEKRGRRVEWERFVPGGRPVAFHVTAHASKLYHQRAIEERLLEAVQRAGGTEAGATLEEEEGERAQLFVVRVLRDRFVISADASGALLHRRGYRQAVGKAPVRETLAAAMLLASGWDGRSPLVDPFCGSGTIPIEGALIARGIPPGLASEGLQPRRFAFQQWADFDRVLWSSVVARAQDGVQPATPGPIVAGDRDAGAIAATQDNARRAGVLVDLDAAARPLSALEPPGGTGCLVTNPPYGRRLGDASPLRDLYATLGRVARERLPGWKLAFLSADRRLEAQVWLKLREVLRTKNGGVPVRLMMARVPTETEELPQ